MIKEKPIKNYEKYYIINNEGQIFSKRQNKYLKFSEDNLGYLHIRLIKNKISKSFLVSRLVALHFVKNPFSKPEVNHLDGDKQNNKSKNLEWCTRSENIKHSFKMGLNKPRRGEKSNFSKISDEDRKNIKKLFNPNKGFKMFQYKLLSDRYKISERQVRYIINNKLIKE